MGFMHRDDLGRPKPIHAYAWILEPLESHASFELRSMFGTKAVYLHGKIVLCFCDKPGPWHGILVATNRVHHASLVSDMPVLKPHSVLSKWLFLADSCDSFEPTAGRLVELVRHGDPRIGVVPAQRKRTQRRGYVVS